MAALKQQLSVKISNAAKAGYPFYVYTLSDDAGVFYVGKGTKARLFQHQKLLDSDKNAAKITRIRASGKSLAHSVVAYFSNSGEAFSYESKLIGDIEGLTNISLGDPVTPYEKAKLKATEILSRIVPFDQWAPPVAVIEQFMAQLGLCTPRQYYDLMVRELKAQIEDPCPTSWEFDRTGKIIRHGYNESATTEPFRPSMRAV